LTAEPKTGATNQAADDKRLALRQTVFKSAKIVFGQAVVDCLVVDVSEAGVRVRTAAIMPVPERVTLEFSGGAVFSAVRRWARGMELGFLLEGSASLPAASAHLAGRILAMLRAASVEQPMQLLRSTRCFDDLALQAAAEQAEAALQQLDAALAERVRRLPS
jgi:hypothetical protein